MLCLLVHLSLPCIEHISFGSDAISSRLILGFTLSIDGSRWFMNRPDVLALFMLCYWLCYGLSSLSVTRVSV